jgi:hypothetical protein
MKKIVLLVCSLALTSVSFQLLAQMDDNAQKAWMAYMTPGDVHKMIAKSDGQWKGDVTWWMAPGQQPMTSTATCTNTMIMGGRYQQSMNKGDMMGMPFEGMGLLGYDNAEKVFTYTWIDNMGTGTMTMKGTWDDATKSINFTGMMVEPMTGKEIPVKETFSITDDNHQVLQMFVAGPDGKDFKSMEIKYTRM